MSSIERQRSPSPLPSPREGRGEGGVDVAASLLLPVLHGEKVRQGMRGSA